MKTAGKTRRDPDMLDEYDFSNGVRGKHVKRLMGGSNIVVQPPDAVKVFAKKRKCDNCGKTGVTQKHIKRIYGHGQNALVIENVPIIVCPHCGASYLEAKTLHEIERIKLHRKSFAEPKHLDVAAFAL